MKKLLPLLLSLIALPALAQISTNPPPIPTSTTGFFTTGLNWLTTFNTNVSWTNLNFDLAAGVDSLQNSKVPIANTLRFGYDAWGPLSIEALVRNGGVTGTFISGQAGFALNANVHDARLSFYVHGGDSFVDTSKRIYVEPGIRISKLMTANTAFFIGTGWQLPRNSQIYSTGIDVRW